MISIYEYLTNIIQKRHQKESFLFVVVLKDVLKLTLNFSKKVDYYSTSSSSTEIDTPLDKMTDSFIEEESKANMAFSPNSILFPYFLSNMCWSIISNFFLPKLDSILLNIISVVLLSLTQVNVISSDSFSYFVIMFSSAFFPIFVAKLSEQPLWY